MSLNDNLLNQNALAARLNHEVSTATLERWRCTGEGPRFVRVGRTPLYRESDVEAWLKSRTVSFTGETAAPGPATRGKRRR